MSFILIINHLIIKDFEVQTILFIDLFFYRLYYITLYHICHYQVTSISPQTGSLAGGTILTITGAGFDDDSLIIRLGDAGTCVPILVESERIECRMHINNIVLIDNNGRHPSK